MTSAVVERWPNLLPHGGIHDEVIAHLTLLEHPERSALDAADRAANEEGSIVRQIRRIEPIALAQRGGVDRAAYSSQASGVAGYVARTCTEPDGVTTTRKLSA